MSSSFSILAHPADLGIEARGATVAEAFEAAARGMMSIIVDPATIEGRDQRKVAITAADPEQLLVRWLSELLYLYDGPGFVGREFLISEIRPQALRAVVWGEPFSTERHGTRLDVKAVTYHQLKIEEEKEGVVLRVYLDV